MHITRCPRCLAEDISADAHPARTLRGGAVAPLFVCRGCYRAAELAFRIACETNGIPYAPLGLREGLRALAAFYAERLRERDDPERYADDDQRARALGPIREALAGVERRLALEPLDA